MHNVDICKFSIVIIMAAIGDSPKKMLCSFVNRNLIGQKIVAAFTIKTHLSVCLG